MYRLVLHLQALSRRYQQLDELEPNILHLEKALDSLIVAIGLDEGVAEAAFFDLEGVEDGLAERAHLIRERTVIDHCL